jgi:large subunit ribosomal protein L6
MSVNMNNISAIEKPVRTSRVGRKPVVLPSGVEVKLQANHLAVKGPKGQLALDVHPFVNIEFIDKQITLSPRSEMAKNCRGSKAKLYKSITGTMRAQIANMIKGVTVGFERKLVLVGVGFRAQMKGKALSLSLGFSHPVDFEIPAGLTIEAPSQTEIIIKGADKNLVGLAAAKIRELRSPEPYKGKGIRYANEKIILKETKKK